MKKAVISIGMVIFASGAGAQQLADPMRPPALSSAAPQASKAAGPTVQMIVVGAERSYAVIDGRTVKQGEHVGDRRVTRIAETEITLRDAAGATTVLKLLPQVQKRPTAPVLLGAETAQGERGKK
jgi:hypothetical protein